MQYFRKTKNNVLNDKLASNYQIKSDTINIKCIVLKILYTTEYSRQLFIFQFDIF